MIEVFDSIILTTQYTSIIEFSRILEFVISKICGTSNRERIQGQLFLVPALQASYKVLRHCQCCTLESGMLIDNLRAEKTS